MNLIENMEKGVLKTVKDEGWVIVDKLRKNAKKGSIDIKSMLYKDVVDPRLGRQHEELTPEEEVMLSRFLALTKIESKIKTFLPSGLLKGIRDVNNAVELSYSKHCIFPGFSYMTKRELKEFLKDVKQSYVELQGQMKPYLADWDGLVVEPFIRDVVRKLLPDLEEEEVSALRRKLPSAKAFAESYEHYYSYSVSPINNQVKAYIVGETKTIKNGVGQILEDDISYMVKESINKALKATVKAYEQIEDVGYVQSRTITSLRGIKFRFEKTLRIVGGEDINKAISLSEKLVSALDANDKPEIAGFNTDLLIHLYSMAMRYGIEHDIELPKDVDAKDIEALIN